MTDSGPQRTPILHNPWVQLLIGITGMVAITNLQYGWTLFVEPLHEKFGWQKYQIQFAFTLFVLAESWLVPIEGYFVDRFGPTLMVGLGAMLIGVAWPILAATDSLIVIYLAQIISGAGAGVVYGTTIANALKWFPHHRGLAAGLTAAAFGAGSAVTVLPISNMIRDQGYQAAFFWFGLGQAAVVLLTAVLLRAPGEGRGAWGEGRGAWGEGQVKGSEGHADPKIVISTDSTANSPLHGGDFTWAQVLRSPIFWLMYVMFVMVTTGGLTLSAQIGSMAKDYKIADVPVSLFGLTMAALPFALALDRVLNGVTRPFFGWVSDWLGRENTMFLAFGLEGAAILLLINLAHVPVLFVLLTGLTFFAWGEAFSIFPALCADIFGRKYATTNYGMLYTAKGVAALLVPVGNLLHEATGGWTAIFVLAVIFDWLAALLAFFVLKPMRIRSALESRL